ncbi:conjugal transfer protein TraD [Acetobacter ghanensis]|uniref:conjugal transfer protein TraD n=1 Tax=Acetobacter ghanensis TaxID=431306 RepID=UPI003D32B2E5
MRGWVKSRRERTRHLIELGGLIQKAGLVDLTDDDRATLFGAFLDIAGQIQGSNETTSGDLKARWRRAGLHAFDRDREHDKTTGGGDHD